MAQKPINLHNLELKKRARARVMTACLSGKCWINRWYTRPSEVNVFTNNAVSKVCCTTRTTISYDIQINELLSDNPIIKGELDLTNINAFIRQINLNKLENEVLKIKFDANIKDNVDSEISFNSIDSQTKIHGKKRQTHSKLYVIISGGIWPEARKHQAGLVNTGTCPHCGRENQDLYHLYWDCDVVWRSQHAEIAKGEFMDDWACL